MKNKAIAPTKELVSAAANFPAFVEAEKLLERMAEFTEETSRKAYDHFLQRGNEFGTHLDDWLNAEMDVLRPTPIEISETKENLNVRAAVPGFKPDEIEISLKGNVLIISGETKAVEKKDNESTFYSEWRSNRFLRQLTLPCEVETEKVEATLKDGILVLSLQKQTEEEAVKVAVKAA